MVGARGTQIKGFNGYTIDSAPSVQAHEGGTKLVKKSSIVPRLLIFGILVVIGWVGVASSDRIFGFLRDRPPEEPTEQGGTGTPEATTNPETPPLTPTFLGLLVQSFGYTSAPGWFLVRQC